MANAFTNPVYIKSKPHASAEKQVGDVDPQSRTDVINRSVKGLVASFKRLIETLGDSFTVDFTDLTTVTAYAGKRFTWAKGADLASAATVTFGTDGNFFDITGTVTITAFATLPAGTIIRTRFTGSLQITYNATSMILRGGVTIQTYNGLVIDWISLGGGNWLELIGSDSYKRGYNNLYDAGTGSLAWTPNCNDGLVQQRTANATGTLVTPTNAKAGMTMIIIFIQDGTGSRVITWPSNFHFPGGTEPVLSTAASAIDVWSGVYGGTNWLGTLSKDHKA